MAELAKYGTQTTFYFPLIDAGAADFESTPVTHASGDSQISKDGGAFANTSNAFAHEGNGIYSIVLTATEMQAAKIVVTLIDTATKLWEDQSIIIDTYGNASAQHAFDLDTATQGVDVVSVSGDSTAADNLEADYDGTGYAKANSTIGTCTTNTDLVSAASVADAVWDEAQSGHVGAGTFGEVATDVAAILVDTGTTLPASISGLNDLSTADILGATVTEAYSTDGTNPTLAEILHEICQQTAEFAISGTTLTVKKRDGSTTAMTFTLDDASDPTSRTRAS